jgi:hypothetical protein
VAPARVARAAEPGLTRGESERLARGETVVRAQDFERGDRRYVGGVTYALLDTSAAEVAALLEDVDAYRRVLPRTKSARLVADDGRDRFIELQQGNALVQAEYTLRVRREPRGPGAAQEYRFWLDPSRPHGIDDAWGFFRLEPLSGPGGEPRVLLTYAVLVDVGPGIVRDFFEERLRAALLSVPELVRRHVALRTR